MGKCPDANGVFVFFALPFDSGFLLTLSPLSEMQNNMTFVRGQYALSKKKKNHDFTEGYPLSWWYENFHLLKPKATDLPSTRTLVFSRSLMIRSLESYKYVKLHLFITVRSWA